MARTMHVTPRTETAAVRDLQPNARVVINGLAWRVVETWHEHGEVGTLHLSNVVDWFPVFYGDEQLTLA